MAGMNYMRHGCFSLKLFCLPYHLKHSKSVFVKGATGRLTAMTRQMRRIAAEQ